MKKVVVKILLFIVLLISVLQSILISYPSRISVEEKKDSGYQAMWEHLKIISAFPHETGTIENQAVAGYIMQNAEKYGFEVDRIPFTITEEDYAKQLEKINGGIPLSKSYLKEMIEINQHVFDKHMENILVKIDRPKSDHAIMFVAHYDSVATSFGAADDGLAVACMLELMHYFSENLPQNDIFLLFTDAEELGLFGAANLVENYSEYRNQVDIVFNFEARGNSGVLTMFESSANNYELVLHLQKSVPNAHAFSLATAIYDQMPNGTDFSEFKNAGYLGLNFAMIDGAKHYHQVSDSWDRLDENSAWHYFQTIRALGNYFGDINMRTIQYEREAVFFPVFPGEILVLPDWIGYVLSILAAGLAFRLIFWTIQRREQYPYKVFRRIFGIFLLGASPIAVALLFFAGSYLVSIPFLLLLFLEFIRMHGEREWVKLACLMLIVTVYITIILFVPIIFMIHLAINIPLITTGFILIPMIPMSIYIRNIMRDIDLKQQKTAQYTVEDPSGNVQINQVF